MFQYFPGYKLEVPGHALHLSGLDSVLFHRAGNMFRSLRRSARIKQLWHRFRRQDGELLDLSSVNHSCQIVGQYDVGPQSVPLSKIVGSASRSQDYDSEFRPMHNHLRNRWVKIAALRLMNISLPGVDLIRIGDAYFVIDGHQRVSVARALGQDYIDAQVIVWHLEVKPSPDMVNASRITPQYYPSGLSLAKGG